MARLTPPAVDRQVNRARRRLFLQNLLGTLAWSLAAALALAVAWFLAQPWLIQEPPAWLRWAVLGALAAAGVVTAVTWAALRSPSRVAAALELDHRFGLRERATTSLTIDPRDADTPAGQAMLADAARRVEPLAVGDKFPVVLRWTAALVPALVLVVALVAWLYEPNTRRAAAGGDELLAKNDPDVKIAQEKVKNLAAKKDPAKAEDRPKSAEVQKIEAEIEKMTQKPTDSKEQVKDLLREMTAIEDKLRKIEQDQLAKEEALKEQLKAMDRLYKKQKSEEADKGLNKAIKDGDFKKSKDELEKLKREMEEREEKAERLKKKNDPDATEQEKKDAEEELAKLEREKEKAQEQLDAAQEQLERLTRDKEEQKQELKRELEEKKERGEITQEELERELEQLEKDLQELDEQTKQELNELAEQLGQCKQCMKDGKDGEAREKLERAMRALEKMDKNGEKGELSKRLRELQEAKKLMTRALDKKNGSSAAQASGERPESKGGDTSTEHNRTKAELDKGKLNVVDRVPGQGFKGPKKPSEIQEEIKQAAQEAPEALSRQKLPRSSSDMAKGFFEKLRTPEK